MLSSRQRNSSNNSSSSTQRSRSRRSSACRNPRGCRSSSTRRGAAAARAPAAPPAPAVLAVAASTSSSSAHLALSNPMDRDNVRSSQEAHFEDADGNVTVTRTDVVRGDGGSQPPPQCGPRSAALLAKAPSQPKKKSRPLVKGWESDFRNQYEAFKSAASNEQRKLIWKAWTKHQRSLVYGDMERRRARSRENSWVCAQTQDGDVHKKTGPSDRC